MAEFPVRGGGTWPLTYGQFRQLVGVYGDPKWVLGELKKAKLWVEANPARRKKNYLRYLVNWLNRAAGEKGRIPVGCILRGQPKHIGEILKQMGVQLTL